MTGIQEIHRSEALVELFQQSFGTVNPAPTLHLLADILATCSCFRVSTVDLDLAVHCVNEVTKLHAN